MPTIYDKIKNYLSTYPQKDFTTTELLKLLSKQLNINISSIIPSDYCYNRLNNGIKFEKHIFLWGPRGKYRFVGENYQYTGPVYAKPRGCGADLLVGEWKNGVYISS